MSLQGQVLWQDSTNYPYINGSIEGQGQWYCFNESTPYQDARVTNNILLLNTNGYDEVAAPTNGWLNYSEFTFASFSLNVSQLPSANGGYFCQFVNNGASNRCCNVFIDTNSTTSPGTYQLAIANYSTSFGSAYQPINYPMDLAPGINYTVVILFDNNPDNETFAGSTLWVNPSEQDWINAEDNDVISPNIGNGYVYATDTPITGNPADFTITQIAFEPYANAGISNVIAGASFESVNTTNLPVIGIQPQSETNYTGDSATFFTVASGADLTYRWHDQFGPLNDGPNVIGSTSNILVLNNLAASDDYYAVITDAYGHIIDTATATNTVITTPTPPFFPASVVAVNLTNTVFTTATFSDVAEGTGPLTYQWYFAPTNPPITFGQLAGQTSSTLRLTLNDYTHNGQYYVVASNGVSGGSIAYGPTNSLTETAPIGGSLAQLYQLVLSMTNQIDASPTSTITVNSANVTVSGYVTTYGGFGSSYSEFFMQDVAGDGIQVYLGGHGNTNTPPVGTYVSVTGPIVIYHAALEAEPASLSAIVPGAAPVVALTPKLENANWTYLTANPLSTNSLLLADSLVTFTNVYIYANKTGTALTPGQTFYADGYTTFYFTVGPYDPVNNTNVMEVYQFGYNYPNTFPASGTGTYSQFYNQVIPTQCAQLTGVYNPYGGFPEIEPSRLADYVVTAPASFAASITETNGKPTIQWPVDTGATYSIWSATTLPGPWTQAAYGLTYYPTNGAFTDTNSAAAKYYRVSNP